MTNSGNYSEFLEEIKKYLPQYLNTEATEDLFKEIEEYLKNNYRNDNVYFSNSHRYIFQGDGIQDLPFINLPDPKVEDKFAFIISNTCDINPDNTRLDPLRVQYCPLISLRKYIEHLKTKYPEDRITNFLDAIKKQRISHIFYLPKHGKLEEDKIALLDRINNCSNDIINLDQLDQIRIFSLSDFGFYLFILKLSIHLTRIREEVSRS